MTQNKSINKIREILKSNKSVVQTSYDIKAPGGEIKVETKEGEGTALTIQLPAGQA